MTLNQVDVDEKKEEADHQDHQDTDTDIKPFPSSPFLITSLSQDGGAPVLLMSEPVF